MILGVQRNIKELKMQTEILFEFKVVQNKRGL